MKLSDFFDVMGPFLAGNVELDDAFARLGPPVDRSRLGIYGRFCRIHREGILDTLFPLVKKVVGDDVWQSLSWKFFAENPTRDWELNSNAEGFADFLSRQSLPPWLSELADVEWFDWATF